MGSKKRLPQMAGGSASALSLSRPAQASLTLRPAGSLSRPTATFVTRLQPRRLPGRAARQLPDQSTTLWVESSSTDDSRLRGALPFSGLMRCDKSRPTITSSATASSDGGTHTGDVFRTQKPRRTLRTNSILDLRARRRSIAACRRLPLAPQ